MMSTSESWLGTTRTRSRLVLEEPEQVLAVRARFHGARETGHVAAADVVHAVGDLLEARHHEPLPLFDRLNVVGRLHQRFLLDGVGPGDAEREMYHGCL